MEFVRWWFLCQVAEMNARRLLIRVARNSEDEHTNTENKCSKTATRPVEEKEV
jgi:hypothetical protein